jgi:tRNA pseudouridine synthase 10
MSTLLEKARQLLAEGDLCDHCLGRAFSQLGKGLRNVQRGRALRTVLNMEGQLFPERESACRVCGGIFAQVPQWAQRAVAAVEGSGVPHVSHGHARPPSDRER